MLLCGDVLKILPTIRPKSVDLIFGSPPYEDCRTYGIGFDLKGQEWVDWMIEVYRKCAVVSRGLVAFVVAGKTRRFKWSATPALLMADLHRAGFNLRRPPIFGRYGVPGSGSVDWLRSNYEFIVCVAPEGKLIWSDNTAMGHPPIWGPGGPMSNREKDGSRVNQWGGSGKQTERLKNGQTKHSDKPSHIFMDPVAVPKNYVSPTLANPGDIIWCGAAGNGHLGSNLAHENDAPFHESLAEFFIRSFCPPGGTVLDPFCGSGTVPAVAVKTGRKYVGIDIRQSQIELTERRLKEVEDEKTNLPFVRS